MFRRELMIYSILSMMISYREENVIYNAIWFRFNNIRCATAPHRDNMYVNATFLMLWKIIDPSSENCSDTQYPNKVISGPQLPYHRHSADYQFTNVFFQIVLAIIYLIHLVTRWRHQKWLSISREITWHFGCLEYCFFSVRSHVTPLDARQIAFDKLSHKH